MSDMMSASVWIAGIGLLITFSTFLASVIFRSGHLAARVEELEKWRGNLRADMHEISDRMDQVTQKLTENAGRLDSLFTLIEERTERRLAGDHPPPDSERRRS